MKAELETYGLLTLQATDTSSENTVLDLGLAEVAVTSTPDAAGRPVVWDTKLLGGPRRSFPSEKKCAKTVSLDQRDRRIQTQY